MITSSAAVTRVCLLSRMARPGLGDLLQRNIFLDLLHRAYPAARITWVLGNHVRRMPLGHDMVRFHSYADEVLFCPDVDDDVLDENGRRHPGEGWQAFLSELSHRRFDVAVIDPRSVRLGIEQARTAGIEMRIAARTGAPDDHGITHFMDLSGPQDLHGYATALASAAGLSEVPPPDRLVPHLPRLPVDLPAWTESRPLLGVHPTCSPGWHRRWPLDRFTEVARRAALAGATVVVFGGPGDILETDLLSTAIRDTVPAARVHSFLGRAFNDTAAAIASVDVLVGNDSGPAHLAAAVGTPSVVIYGPDGEEAMWRRSYPQHTGLNKHFACQQRDNEDWDGDAQCALGCPCYYVSPDGDYPRCLTAVSVEEVWDVVAKRLVR